MDGITKSFPLTASIKVGDKITAIDGRSTQGMTYIEATYRLNGYEGTDAKLTLERKDNKSVKITLPRRSDFQSLVRSELGIRLLTDPENPPHVVSIEPKSSADQAGIEVGDELIEIDGEPAKTMLLNEIISKIEVNGQENKQTKRLMFKRKHDGKTLELKAENHKT